MSATLSIPPLGAHTTTGPQRLLALVRIAALRSLKVRYRGTFLGVLWSFGNPVMMTTVYSVLFGTAFAKYYDGSVLRYLFSTFVGLVVVTFFMNATSEALITIVANGPTLNKIAVPPSVFPLAAVSANLFQQSLTTFPVVLLVSILVTHDPMRIALVPVVVAALAMLTIGFALGLSALYVFFRDLSYIWGIAGFVLWLTSPLFYPASLVPAHVRVWFAINPIGQVMAAMREVALAEGPIHFAPIGLALASGILACVAGALVFRATQRDFMDLL